MRILVLSHYFFPEPIPKPLELAEALRDDGHSVEVVTGFPNYPDGNLYPGFRLRPLVREQTNNLPVIRTFMYPSHGTSRVGRMLNYGSFMVSSILGGMFARRFDVIYVWHPPLSIGVSAAVIAFLRRRAFVYDVQDIWPESAIETGFLRPGALFNFMSRLERFIYRRAAHVLVVTDGAKKNLRAKGVPEEKITVAPHWFDDTAIVGTGEGDRRAIREKEGWNGRFVIMFAGNMGVLQGLETVLYACRELPESGSIVVALVGDGSDLARLKGLARELDLGERITFVPRQPAAEMGRYFAAADALLVHLRASPLTHLIVPSKTIAYLAAAKPIVLAGTGASADIVSTANAGVVVPPGDPAALASALIEISELDAAERARMGESGRGYFEQHYTKEVTLPTYVSVLRRCARFD